MIKLEDRKELTQDKPIREAKLPKEAIIPLSQHIGKISEAVVTVGEKVKLGQLIGRASGLISSNIHSSISGIVKAIEEWPHPVIGRCLSVIIESDGLDEQQTPNIKHNTLNIDKLSPDEIRKIIFEAGIVGLGGAAFPTQVKLEPPKDKKIDSFILNGAECEPYLTCDYRIMVESPREILEGMNLMLRALGIRKGYIAIEDNKPEAIKKMREELDKLKIKHCALHILKTYYPQGAEKQLIKKILGREVPSGGLPFDVGVVVQNVGTSLAVYEAIFKGKPLYERVVTVSGDCLENPANLRARIGTPIRDLIEECSPLREPPSKIILGGPMMGIAQYSDEVPLIKGTTGIILLSEERTRYQEYKPCIRCGECIENCPARIMPATIGSMVERDRFDLAKSYDPLDCIECGICSYLCPAKRPLVAWIKLAKVKLAKKT